MHTKNFSALFPALLCGYLCYGQNLAPSVSLTAPINGALFQQGQSLNLTATAADTDGSISKVEFYQDGQKMGESTDFPFSYLLEFAPPGIYEFTAKAYDNKGASTLSSKSKVIINAQPFAFLSSPTNNSIFQGNANLILLARVGDTDDEVTKVEFLQNGVKVGEDLSAPYSLSLSNLEPGPYFFAVKAFDTRGGVGVSTPAAVLVNAVPNLTLQSPENKRVFSLNATVNFSVLAKDPDGIVKKVEYFINNQKVGSDTIAPYEYEYVGNSFGNFTFFARATDDLNGIASSTVLNFIINAPPLVAISSPSSGAKFVPGSVLTLQVNANDVDGSISRVTFWQNGAQLGEDKTAPYTFIVNGLNSGGYIFAVKAFDNQGDSSTSQPIAVLVNAPPNLSIIAPGKDTTIRQGTPLNVRMNANDPDGELIKVELYVNEVKVGEDVQAPFAITLTNLPLGKHVLRARAWDDVGDVKESGSLTITVSNTTSLKEIQYSELKFFPNPVREKLFFQDLQKQTRIQIFDMVGRKMQETSASQELNVAKLSPGRYWIITQDGQRASFIKQ